MLGTDASKFDPDGPLPKDLPETNATKTGRANTYQVAKQKARCTNHNNFKQNTITRRAYIVIDDHI